jgi:hypothetical protein
MYRLGLSNFSKRIHGIFAKFNSERGSVSLLIIGLFIVLFTTTIVLTDISSIYLAKRSLILTTEAAVQRGMKNLDSSKYYSGEYNLTEMLGTVVGRGQGDPGIPIDCEAGKRDVEEVIFNWKTRGDSYNRANLRDVSLDSFECDGFQIYITSSAVARIPIPIPFTNIETVHIKTHAGAVGERAKTNNFYGLDIG